MVTKKTNPGLRKAWCVVKQKKVGKSLTAARKICKVKGAKKK